MPSSIQTLRSNGFTRHTLPGLDQHLQLHQQRLAQRRGHDGHLRLDARLHVFHLRSSTRLRLHPLLPPGKGPFINDVTHLTEDIEHDFVMIISQVLFH